MQKINLQIEDFSDFKGLWGLTPYEIFIALKNTTYKDKLNILEFGSGDGTTNLVNLLNKKLVPFNYISVENDKNFATTENVNYIMYDLPIDVNSSYDEYLLDKVNLKLDDTIFDLVIVDGPHGVGRSRWYQKFKNNTREGTIILVDDFFHYTQFEDELNKNFKYDLINVFSSQLHITGNFINEGEDLTDMNHKLSNFEKCYKIVKVKK